MDSTATKPAPMKANEFKAIQAALGHSNMDMADCLGVSLSTVEKWRAGSVKVSRPAAKALRLIVDGGQVNRG